MTNRRPLPKALTGIVALATVALCLTSATPMASAAPFAYMANMSSGTVSVVDAAQPGNPVVVVTLPVGLEPRSPSAPPLPADVAVNPAGTRAYVANYGENTVSIIETASVSGGFTHKVVDTIRVGNMPGAIAVHPTGSTIYVANGGGTISVIDATHHTVTEMVGFGNLMGIAINRAGTRLYVTDETAMSVFAIDLTGSGARRQVRVGEGPLGIAVNPAGTRVYAVATDSLSGNAGLWVIDAGKLDAAAPDAVEAIVPVGARPIGVAVNPSGSLVYVTSESEGSVSVVYARLNEVVETVDLAARPHGVAVDPTGAYVFIGNAAGNIGRVSVMNAASNTMIAWAKVETGPASFGAFVSGGPMPSGPAGPSADEVTMLRTLLQEANATLDALRAQVDILNKAKVDLQKLLADATMTIDRMRAEYQHSNETLASFIRRLMTGRTDENVAAAARDAAQEQLRLATASMGTRDWRIKHARKEMDRGLAAMAARRYQRAVKDFAEVYEICWRLRRS